MLGGNLLSLALESVIQLCEKCNCISTKVAEITGDVNASVPHIGAEITLTGIRQYC